MRKPTAKEIAQIEAGDLKGFTKAKFAELGISWPLKAGWKEKLLGNKDPKPKPTKSDPKPLRSSFSKSNWKSQRKNWY